MGARQERVGERDLVAMLDEQARQISELGETLEERRKMGGRRRSGQAEERGGELGYRFDSYPKWLEASGWKDQEPKHRRAWPLLRRFLELERWPGAHVRFTLDQLADHLCFSRDTARRRLRELESLGVMTHERGRGRKVSTVRISHPIATPLSYSEVTWALGGLAGAPEGYAENLSGAKRHYARLYGAELPAAVPHREPLPALGRGDAPEETVSDSSSASLAVDVLLGRTLRPEREKVGKAVKQGLQDATSESATCYPLETVETKTWNDLSGRSDGKEKKEENRQKIREMEQQVNRVAPETISEGSIEDARQILEAVGKRDPELAIRAAQLAQLLASTGKQRTLREALSRVRRSARNTEIVHPIRYVLATVLDIMGETKAGAKELDLGKSILRSASASSENRRERGKVGEGKRSITEGYEWLFKAPKNM